MPYVIITHSLLWCLRWIGKLIWNKPPAVTSLLYKNSKWNELMCTFAAWMAPHLSKPYPEPFFSLSVPEKLPFYISDLHIFCLCMILFKKESLCLIFLCIHKCAWHTRKEGTSIKEFPPWDWPVHICGAFSWLLTDVGEPSSLWTVTSFGKWV